MRLRSHEEEKPSIPAFDTVVEESDEHLEQAASVPKPGLRRFSAGGRAVRLAIVAVASLVAVSGILFSITGVPLWEWLRDADFKKAYSMDNVAFSRGLAAEQVGDLAGATSALLSLPADSSEAQELSGTLFPKLLEKGDFKRAASVIGFVKITQMQVGPTMSAQLGQALGRKLGLSKGLAFVQDNSDISAVRQQTLSGLFSEVAAKELPELERLSESWKGPERAIAMESIATAYVGSKDFDQAWKWASKISDANRARVQDQVLGQWSSADLEASATKLAGLPANAALDNARNIVGTSLASSNPPLAKEIVSKMTPGALRESAIRYLGNVAQGADTWERRLSQVDAISSAPKRAADLVSLAISDLRLPSHLEAILNRLEKIAQKDLSTVRLHDDLVRYLIAGNRSLSTAKRFEDRVLDADARAALKKEIAAGGPTEATLVWAGGRAKVSATGSSSSYSMGGF
jgi:hypothetical protein